MSKYFIEDGRVFRADVYEPVSQAELELHRERLRSEFKEIGEVLASLDEAINPGPTAPVAAAPAPVTPAVPETAPVAPDVSFPATLPPQPTVQDVVPPTLS